jgi:hypothetical protein
MQSFMLVMFTIASGLTLSGIVANLYRLMAREPKNTVQSVVYYAVMVFGGPSVLFDNATRSFRKKECSGLGWVVALGLATYWAMVLGAILLDVVVSV